jgi:alpha-glucosidase
VQTAYHDGTPDFLTLEPGRDATLLSTGTAFVRVRAPHDTVAVWVESYPDGEQRLDELKLERQENPARQESRVAFWSGRFPYRATETTRYRFKLIVPDDASNARMFPGWFRGNLDSIPPGRTRAVWLTQAGLSVFPPTLENDFKIVSQNVPEWVTGAVFYQIFPDRFRDGDPTNNVSDGEYRYGTHDVKARAWHELPDARQGWREFFGGDLEGLRQSIPYLTDLGVNAIYLNPIFKSPSSHKYDTEDYLQIDPHFGTNESFRDLVRVLHDHGIRVMLDGVFNHAGVHHSWFQDALRGGDGRRFFTFASEEPGSYVSWLGVKTLPKLDYASDEVHDAVYRLESSIVKHWLRSTRNDANNNSDDGVDAWRLDVIHMMGRSGTHAGNHQIIAGIRAAMRQVKPDSYLLGEHFFEASPWLQGLEEDGAMNYYGFTWPVWGFLVGADHRAEPLSLNGSELDQALRNARAKLPFAHQLAQFNLLDSHDVPRFISLVPDERFAHLGAALLMTYIGVPCVYYGDEIGLHGGPDPDNRRPMPWDERTWNLELRKLYQRLIALRRSSAALQRGGFETLHAGGDSFAFVRQLGGESVTTALTRGSATTLELGVSGRWRDALSGDLLEARNGVLHVPLRDVSFRILRLEL